MGFWKEAVVTNSIYLLLNHKMMLTNINEMCILDLIILNVSKFELYLKEISCRAREIFYLECVLE
jgi:hypothetical protein